MVNEKFPAELGPQQELTPPFLFRIRAAKDSGGRERGFGFVSIRIPREKVLNYPGLVEDVPDAQRSELKRLLEEGAELFIHIKNVRTGPEVLSELDGAEIVLVKLGFNSERNKFFVSEAMTIEAWKRMKEEEQEKRQKRAEKESWEAEKAEFKKDRPQIIEEARAIAEKYGAEVDVSDPYEITVFWEADKKLVHGWLKAYRRALDIDQKIVASLSLGIHSGRFAGARINHLGMIIDEDTGEGGDFPEVVEEPVDAPAERVILWRRTPGETIDLTERADDLKRRLDGSKWLEVVEEAEDYWRQVITQKDAAALAAKTEGEREDYEKAQATEALEWLIGKEPLPGIEPGKSKETNWLGLDVRVSNLGRALGEQKYEFMIGGEWIGIRQIWEDPRELVQIAKKNWDEMQPAEAVVKDETRGEAIERLKSWCFLESNLPSLPVKWDISYVGRVEGSESLDTMPNAEGVWDQTRRFFTTHNLVLSGPGFGKKEVVGSIVFGKRSSTGRWQAKLQGPDFADIEGVITGFLEINPELDPRVLKVEWKAIKEEAKN